MKKLSAATSLGKILMGSLLLLVMAGAALGAEFQQAPLNPEFVTYMSEERTPEAPGGNPRGYAPAPIDLSHVQGPVFPRQAYPVSMDLRNLGGKSYVTPVRNQNPYGTCWAFGTLGSLESTVLRSTGGMDASRGHTWSSGNPDYSEWHLAYFCYIDQSASLPGFGNYTTANLPAIFNNGGQDWKATALLARWTGAVSEDDAPYGDTSNYPTGNESARNHLEYAYYLPSTTTGYSAISKEDLKYILTTYGAACIGMYVSDNMAGNISGVEWNPATAAYYYKGSDTSNHAVTAVGWDDNYSASNFHADQQPPGMVLGL